MTLTFDPKINLLPELMIEHIIVKFGDPSHIGFWDMQKNRDASENLTRMTTVGVGKYNLLFLHMLYIMYICCICCMLCLCFRLFQILTWRWAGLKTVKVTFVTLAMVILRSDLIGAFVFTFLFCTLKNVSNFWQNMTSEMLVKEFYDTEIYIFGRKWFILPAFKWLTKG